MKKLWLTILAAAALTLPLAAQVAETIRMDIPFEFGRTWGGASVLTSWRACCGTMLPLCGPPWTEREWLSPS
jgi:hypothetical protein